MNTVITDNNKIEKTNISEVFEENNKLEKQKVTFFWTKNNKHIKKKLIVIQQINGRKNNTLTNKINSKLKWFFKEF